MMSGQRYAQATSEECTELVTNRSAVKPLHWDADIARNVESPFESQSAANLPSDFSNLRLSSHGSSYHPSPYSSQYSQFTGGASSMPVVQRQNHQSQQAEFTEARQASFPDPHLR